MNLKHMSVSDILRSHEERIGSIELLIRWIPTIFLCAKFIILLLDVAQDKLDSFLEKIVNRTQGR